jgi:hypothetical protein
MRTAASGSLQLGQSPLVLDMQLQVVAVGVQVEARSPPAPPWRPGRGEDPSRAPSLSCAHRSKCQFAIGAVAGSCKWWQSASWSRCGPLPRHLGVLVEAWTPPAPAVSIGYVPLEITHAICCIVCFCAYPVFDPRDPSHGHSRPYRVAAVAVV